METNHLPVLVIIPITILALMVIMLIRMAKRESKVLDKAIQQCQFFQDEDGLETGNGHKSHGESQ